MLIHGLKIEYSGRVVLDIDGLSIENSGITAIMGPNGAGKSTLLRALAGAIACPSMTIEDRPERLAYMTQKPYMFRGSAMKNAMLGMERTAENEAEAARVLTELGMGAFLDKRNDAKRLSGGEKQRVALGRTVLTHPNLLLLDEPTSAADVQGVLAIESFLKKLAGEGIAVLMTTHNPAQAMRIADRAIMLWGGRIIEQGTPREVLVEPRTEEGRLFAESVTTFNG